MISENQKTLNRLQIFLDLMSVPISFLLAYFFRFDIFNGTNNMTFDTNVLLVFLLMPVFFLAYSSFGLYSSRRTKPFGSDIAAILYSNVFAAIVFSLILYVGKIMHFSRYVVVLFTIFNTAITITTRLSIRLILTTYRKKGYNKRFCLVIGTNDLSRRFIEKTRKHPEWGYEITGIVAEDTYKKSNFWGISIISHISKLSDVLANRYFDFVVIALAPENYISINSIIPICEKSGTRILIIPYYSEYIPAKPYFEDLDGLPLIDTRYIPLDYPVSQMAKRAFDILFSLFAIVLTSPVMLVAAILTKLTSPGPILYKQERMGLNQKTFNMYKFRSMRVQSEKDSQTIWTTKDDPRKTKWGEFMRKTSIDELPQFFNILSGSMSVVGPRPERPFFVSQFKETIPRYMLKHQVRPGLTGWAQVNGWRGDTSIEKRIEHDIYYIENWSFMFDLKIILLTVFKGFINKNAY